MGWLFTHLLRETFSLLSMIPIDIPLTVMAEILVTSIVGIMFWSTFQEAAEQRAFREQGSLAYKFPVGKFDECFQFFVRRA